MSPAMRYHGSKWRLFPWLSQFIPPHRIYIDAFGGSAAVLLQKPRVESEVYNDLDGDVVNYFRVLRDPEKSLELEKLIRLTPYSRQEFETAYDSCDDPIERARALAVRAQMGFGSSGSTKQTTGFRSDSARQYGTAASNWAEFPDRIPALTARLQGVLIEHRSAVEVMRTHDHPEAFVLLDPPYIHDTRKMGGVVYRHEMSESDHIALCVAAAEMDAMVILCGYDNGLYTDLLDGWETRSARSRISAGRGTKVKTETIWINPACIDAQQNSQQTLFSESAGAAR